MDDGNICFNNNNMENINEINQEFELMEKVRKKRILIAVTIIIVILLIIAIGSYIINSNEKEKTIKEL